MADVEDEIGDWQEVSKVVEDRHADDPWRWRAQRGELTKVGFDARRVPAYIDLQPSGLEEVYPEIYQEGRSNQEVQPKRQR